MQEATASEPCSRMRWKKNILYKQLKVLAANFLDNSKKHEGVGIATKSLLKLSETCEP